MRTTTETYEFGLIAWLEKTRVRLPLKGIECRFDITSGVATVEVDQIFLQENAKALDCTYTFPLPASAAAYSCEVDINGRIIHAKVEEKREARRIFNEQKAQGRRAALVESERENVFTLTLGNVQPGDLVLVRLAYVQAVERGGGEQRRLRVPVCPGVRYIPGKPLLRSQRGKGTADDTDEVPDASRISPPRIDELHPDASYFAISGTLPVTDAAKGTLSSPTHPLRAELGEAHWRVTLNDNGAVPDRDFVVLWEPPVEHAITPRAWSSSHDGHQYALVQLRAPQDVAVADDFEQDFYFLVDRSGSMEGEKWAKTCVALTEFVRLLGQRDRVWITLFETNYQDFSEEPLPAHDVRDDSAFKTLSRLGIGGGTELVQAAKHVIDKVSEHSSTRRSVIIVITDGEVGNEQSVMKAFKPASGTTVFTFGIDTAVNDALLKNLATQHGGTCVLQTPHDDIAAAVRGLGDRLRRPVVTDLQAADGWEGGRTRLPDLFRGETADVVLRTENECRTIRLIGKRADGREESWELPLAEASSQAPRLLWVRERIAAYEAANEGSRAIELAKKHNMLCRGAAFIAWDEAERVEVATEEVYQPSRGGIKYAMALRVAAPAPAPDTAAAAGGGSARTRALGKAGFSLTQAGSSLGRLLKRRFGGDAETTVREEPSIVIVGVVALPSDISGILNRWLENDTIRGDRKRAYDKLIEAIRELGKRMSRDRAALLLEIRMALVEFARAHLEEAECGVFVAAIEVWGRSPEPV